MDPCKAVDIEMRNEKIKKSQEEIEPYLNFLREDRFLNPETPILKKPNREDFFGDFHEEQNVYHRLVDKWDQHELKCYMLIPKTLDNSKTIPFHVLFHGGGLTTGGGNYVHWFSDYKRNLAIDANAITLIPMHRLMPEDRGKEIYTDVRSWWEFYYSENLEAWVEDCLKKHGQDECITKLSKENLLVSGESAGGLLAVYSWIFCPLHIQALYLQYPMLRYYEKIMPEDGVEYMGLKISAEVVKQRATELLEVVKRQHEEDCVVSRSDSKPPIGMAAAMLLSNTQEWESWFKGEEGSSNKASDALGLLQRHCNFNTPPASFPKIFIIHGTKDTACPIQDTRAFVEILENPRKGWYCAEEVHLSVFEDQGHAFDYEVKGKPFEDQINEVMKSVITAWLSPTE